MSLIKVFCSIAVLQAIVLACFAQSVFAQVERPHNRGPSKAVGTLSSEASSTKEQSYLDKRLDFPSYSICPLLNTRIDVSNAEGIKSYKFVDKGSSGQYLEIVDRPDLIEPFPCAQYFSLLAPALKKIGVVKFDLGSVERLKIDQVPTIRRAFTMTFDDGVNGAGEVYIAQTKKQKILIWMYSRLDTVKFHGARASVLSMKFKTD